MPWSDWSLRSKLIVACVLVQLAAAALLVFHSTELLQRTLATQATFETQQVAALLDQAIAAPLAQRDYATLQQTLDLVRSDKAINYLVLRDHRGKVVASSGWDESRPLPARDAGEIDLDRSDATWHLGVPVKVAGQPLGQVDLGLSTARLRQARADFLHRAVWVGSAALAVSMLVLAGIAYAITRHLARLAQASQCVAQGDFNIHLTVRANDEIGRLGASFNAMAAALKERVAALETSEAQQKRHLNVAREEKSRLTTLLGAMQSGIMFVDEKAQVVYANASFARLWAVPEIASGHRLADILPVLVRQIEPADAQHLELMSRAATVQDAGPHELHTLDGRIIVQRVQAVAQVDDGGGSIWIHDDVTLDRHTQQRAHQALHDPLTALVNRRGYYEALRTAVDNAASSGASVSLLFVDLDDFKHANDVAGHRTGDDILVTVAHTLTAQMRKGEIVARLGGDEFAVLCPGIEAPGAAAIAARLVQAISELRFPTSERTLRIGCSVGVASLPADARNGDDLVACADAAMYQAKRGGKNNWAAFQSDPQRLQLESARVNWNARIHRALQGQRFVLHFQPVLRAADLSVAHHEALVRMLDEDDPGRVISPAEFIPHAESSGMIRQIDRWVFEACVARLAAADPAVCIAANLSARSLEDASFPGFLRSLFQRCDLDPRRLHIELTETSAISDPMVARQLIDTLRGLGCAVHLDDFGSGFSSFAHLKLLDVDAIKIDGNFIRNLQSDSSNRLFVASMIEIAHNLNKTVIAEHVEDEGTLEALRGLGVDLVQGFHLGRPGSQLTEQRARGHLAVVADFRRGTRSDVA
ncbi:diguanylate cyclase (GGDEF) domain-containing protein [Burkholderiales bacterium JOSHI_001]|nr:diguanylate cyclase (GGDEF) domain-containing protein [Burkholderiales bacterium JOSHI_001]